MKKIVIAGASGFVGKYLSSKLLEIGFSVTGIGTSQAHPFEKQYPDFGWISADTTLPGSWQKDVANCDAVINLTGRSIFHYWSKKYKQAIYDSRVLTTRNIVAALDENRPQKLLNASAVGIYGDRYDSLLTEDEPAGNDFLARVCVDWENAALKAREKKSEVGIMRFGVVLGDGGALGKMIPAFKMFAGGPLGSGLHWFPWIHIEDLANAVIQLIKGDLEPDIYNFTGPHPIRQKEFAKNLAKNLGRPAFMPSPSFIIRTVMGELGGSLLQSQKAIPKRLTDAGFEFQFPDVSSALADILTK